MSDKCGNCDCADKSQCVKKGTSYGVVIVDAEKRAGQAARVHDVRVEWNDYSIPLAGVHQRSGEQVSGTSAFDVLHREKAAISHFEMAEEVGYEENDGKCKCTTGCSCAGCNCGK
uniref:Uncharacterized protein n=1 Tax=Oryza sativa subsp. japonica TaxID=39947 RepID=Q6L4P5_ORYSJ|nr:hypothetical protein [Oryza sativa Japonica Group]